MFKKADGTANDIGQGQFKNIMKSLAEHFGAKSPRELMNTAVGTSTIARVTNGFGPFPTPTRGSSDTLSLRGVSRLSGVSVPALRRRVANGDLPAPAGYGPRGWRFWLKADIISWLEASDLEECRLCGARLKSIGWHLVSRHGLDTAQYRRAPAEVR